jgi:hypothetical protein
MEQPRNPPFSKISMYFMPSSSKLQTLIPEMKEFMAERRLRQSEEMELGELTK